MPNRHLCGLLSFVLGMTINMWHTNFVKRQLVLKTEQCTQCGFVQFDVLQFTFALFLERAFDHDSLGCLRDLS